MRRALQTHARHEPQASGAVSLLSAIATALSTAANRKNKFFIHFDKPYAGVTTEKVDLKGTLGTLGTIR
jgi:hypothetical protein